MITDIISVQQQVFAELKAVLAPLPVVAAPIGDPRYIRVEGFTLVNDELYKNRESNTHRFSVNAFDSPEGGTNSLAWTWNTLAAVKLALNNLRVGNSKLIAEEAQAWFTPKASEGVFGAQGFIRYRVQIGA